MSCGCLKGVLIVFGGVLIVSERCLEGFLRESEECLEGSWNVSVRCYGTFMEGVWKLSIGACWYNEGVRRL